VSNGDDIEAKYDIRLEIPERDLWSMNWFFTPDNKNKSPEAWKQVTATSFKVLEDWLKTNNPKAIYISGNTGAKTKLYKMYIDKLQTLLNNRYKIDNSDEDRIVLRSIEEVYQSGIKKRMETLNESYEQALSYWQNGDINSKSKIERWNSIKKKIERQVIQEIYQTKKPNISKSSKKDPFGINQYARELAQGLEEQKQDYIIYCDMDGVIADFDARFRELAKMSPDQYEEKYGIEKFWNFIDNEIGVRFWVGIPWMQDGKQLWEYIKKYKPTLLSAPSRNNESRLGKRLWVKKHIPGTKLVLASRVNKQDYAKPNAILIDDRPDTIVEWENKGGVN
jgi:PAS domain-containing protein